MKNVVIKGVHGFFPSKITSNKSIAGLIGKNNIWGNKSEKIQTVLGVRKRLMACRFTEDGFPDKNISEVDLVIQAASKALVEAKCTREEIGLLIVVSGIAPSSLSKFGSEVAHALQLGETASVMQLSQACAGFLSALGVAEGLLRGNYLRMLTNNKKVLIVASNHSSKLAHRTLYLEANAVSSLIVFGDGAGAIVLDMEETESGIKGFLEISNSSPENALISLVPGKTTGNELVALRIEGNAVMNQYVTGMTRVVRALEELCPEAKNADHYFFHQPREALVDHLIYALNIDRRKVPSIVEAVGNIGQVFIPILMAKQMKRGKIKIGDRIVCATIGDGNKICSMFYRIP